VKGWHSHTSGGKILSEATKSHSLYISHAAWGLFAMREVEGGKPAVENRKSPGCLTYKRSTFLGDGTIEGPTTQSSTKTADVYKEPFRGILTERLNVSRPERRPVGGMTTDVSALVSMVRHVSTASQNKEGSVKTVIAH